MGASHGPPLGLFSLLVLDIHPMVDHLAYAIRNANQEYNHEATHQN
jgi:hypothetical protein